MQPSGLALTTSSLPGGSRRTRSDPSPIPEATTPSPVIDVPESTRRAYASDWRHWEAWCGPARDAWPASPLLVARYLEEQASPATPDGTPAYSAATLKRRVAAIGAGNRRLGASPPSRHPRVQQTVRQIEQRLSRPARAEPAESEHLHTVIYAIRAQRGQLTWAQRTIARRDIALLTVGWALGLQLGELTGLDTATTIDQAVIRTGQLVKIPTSSEWQLCPACALRDWTQALHAWDTGGRPHLMRLMRQQDRTSHICQDSANASTQANYMAGHLADTTNAPVPLFRSIHRSGVIRNRITSEAVRIIWKRRAAAAGLTPTRLSFRSNPAPVSQPETPPHPPAAAPAGPHSNPETSAHRGHQQTTNPNQPNAGSDVPTTATRTPSTSRYCLEWTRFRDWCTATDRNPLPAEERDILQYLHDENPGGGTAARWLTAIRTTHRSAGYPDPCGAAADWVRAARDGAAPAHDEVRRAATRTPTHGWPAGLFGRRDRLAVILHGIGHVPVPRLIELKTAHLTIPAPFTLRIGATVDREFHDPDSGDTSGSLCPACAAIRWAQALQIAQTYSFRTMRNSLNSLDPPVDRHICTSPANPGTIAPGWPLFPPIDRWGAIPLPPVPAMSLRAAQEMLRAVKAGRAHQRAITAEPARPVVGISTPAADHVAETRRSGGSFAPNARQVTRKAEPTLKTLREKGIAARSRTIKELEDVSGRWDDVDLEITKYAQRAANAISSDPSIMKQ